jgi:hypothetical protein
LECPNCAGPSLMRAAALDRAFPHSETRSRSVASYGHPAQRLRPFQEARKYTATRCSGAASQVASRFQAYVRENINWPRECRYRRFEARHEERNVCPEGWHQRLPLKTAGGAICILQTGPPSSSGPSNLTKPGAPPSTTQMCMSGGCLPTKGATAPAMPPTLVLTT